jgi:predicted ester cyclase
MFPEPDREDESVTGPSAKAVVEELFRRGGEGDQSVIDELIDIDMVNHAAGPQGREGWKLILAIIEGDLGPVTITNHHLFGEGDLVAHHMTMRGTHHGSTMPLLIGVPISDAPIEWTYIHIWRVADGKIVEHWACRDDVGLLAQIGAWPR